MNVSPGMEPGHDRSGPCHRPCPGNPRPGGRWFRARSYSVRPQQFCGDEGRRPIHARCGRRAAGSPLPFSRSASPRRAAASVWPGRQSLKGRGSVGAKRRPSARAPPEGGREGPEAATREVPTGTDRDDAVRCGAVRCGAGGGREVTGNWATISCPCGEVISSVRNRRVAAVTHNRGWSA
jgi:hypothetical protein